MSNIRSTDHERIPRYSNWMTSKNPRDERSNEPHDNDDLRGMQKFPEALVSPGSAEKPEVEEQDGGFGHADDD